MNGLIKTPAALLLSTACLAGTANAGLITGSIQFSGASTNDTTSLLTSTTLQSFTGTGTGGLPVVQFGDSGSYGSVPGGTAVNFNPFVYTGVGVVLPTTLWSFTYSGQTYSFTATSITSVATSSHMIPNVGEQDFLSITGVGTVSITGGVNPPSPNQANFTITESGPPGATSGFNFAESITVVPEPSVLALGALATVPVMWRVIRGRSGRK